MQRFHGICLLTAETVATAVLVVRAATEEEASRKLHAAYNIEAVVEILTEEESQQRRRKMGKSLHGSGLNLY